MNNKIFSYHGQHITFSTGESVMVNATQMAKPFNKRPIDWLNLQSTKEFLSEYSNVRENNISDNQIVTKQGSPENGGGTWMHQDIALAFAQWLSPKFYVWRLSKIKELLTTGHTELQQKLKPYSTQEALSTALSDPDFVIGLLQSYKEEKTKREKAEAKIEADAPIVEFGNCVMASATTYSLKDTAAILARNGLTNKRGKPAGRTYLCELLRKRGYFTPNNMPYQRFLDCGWFDVAIYSIDRGWTTTAASTTYVTPKGLEALIGRLCPPLDNE